MRKLTKVTNLETVMNTNETEENLAWKLIWNMSVKPQDQNSIQKLLSSGNREPLCVVEVIRYVSTSTTEK